MSNAFPEKISIVAVVGPTAGGKTALGIALAEQYSGEIVSADSRQIYRGMDIGTAKPSVAERRGIPHHLIDLRDPSEDYTLADYQHDAIAAIRDIAGRGKLPILVGGTGLYVRAVLENLDIPKANAQPELRAKIEQEIDKEGLAAVFAKLVARDPEAAYVVDPKNPRRVIRALEVAITTGVPFTAQRKTREPIFDALMLGLNPPPDILHSRIDRRVDAMMDAGLIDEVRTLVGKYGTAIPALDAIGYREIIDYWEGNATLGAAAASIKANTWHYAKRQMTWFRKTAGVHWIAPGEDVAPLVSRFIT